ncbi:MAG: PsbP-related protein [Candidatus Nitrosocosmicus sp.]
MIKYWSLGILLLLIVSLPISVTAQDSSSELTTYMPIINDISLKIYQAHPTVDPQMIKNAIENMIKGTIQKGGNPQDSLQNILQEVSKDPRGKIAQTIVSMSSKATNETSPETQIIKPSASNSSTTKENFLIYTNSEHGFSIKYPSSWDVLTGNRIPGSHIEEVEPLVVFVPPGEIATSNAFTAFVELAINHEAEDLDLNGVIQDNIRDIMRQSSLSNFVIDNANTNGLLSGKPAYILSYSADRPTTQGVTTFVVKEIGTKVGDDYFFVNYIATKDKESKFLSLAQEMVKSFKLD